MLVFFSKITVDNSLDFVTTVCRINYVDEFATRDSKIKEDCTFPFWLYIFVRFRELGKRVFYVTNNSTKHRREYKTKVDKLGFGGSLVGNSCQIL